MANLSKRVLSLALVMSILIGLFPSMVPAAEAAGTERSESSASGSGITLTQKAEWDSTVPGEKVVKITLQISSQMELTTPKDVVFVVGHAAQEPIAYWKQQAQELTGMLRSVSGMRYALVTYASTAETPLDFTENAEQLTSAVSQITKGVNNNGYAALKAAKELIDRRSDTSREACIVLLGSGRFNLNVKLSNDFIQALDVPLYGIKMENNQIGANPLLIKTYSTANAAIAIGESATCSDVVVTGRLDTSHFAPISSIPSHTDGVFTYRIPKFQRGSSRELTFEGTLTDPTEAGTLSAALAASMEGDGMDPLFTDGVSVERSSLSVTYNANGADTGTAPTDSSRYSPGVTVAVKPASLQKLGWNFSGWTHPNINISGGKFEIVADTELSASWGRAYVKLGSSTIHSDLKGTRMLNRASIERLPGNAFYNPEYWGKLESLTIHKSVSVPADCVASWDITDTSVPDNTQGAVMAWVVKNAADNTKYDLHIGGRGGLAAPEDSQKLFSGCTAAVFNNIGDLDTSNVTNMLQMFYDCENVEALDLSSWDTSKVTNMCQMFAVVNSYGSLKTKLTTLNLSGWVTTNVENMGGMFDNCALVKDFTFVENWNTSNVQSLYRMFQNCRMEKLDLHNWNTSNITEDYYFGLANVFENCIELTSLNLSGWDVSKAKTFESIFAGCSRLTDLNLEGWNPESALYMEQMFQWCKSLPSLDLSGWDTSNVKNMAGMFRYCERLESLNVSGFDTSKVTNMSSMFEQCYALRSLDLTGWDTSEVSSSFRSAGGMRYMFARCRNLETLEGLENWNTSKVTDMTGMFLECKKLTSLDLKNWDMTSVEEMYYMLQECLLLTTIGRNRLDVAKDCKADNLQKDSPNLPTISVYAGGQLIDSGTTYSLRASQSEETDLGEEADFSEYYPDGGQEENTGETVFSAGITSYAAAPNLDAVDTYGRPVYACKKAGLWDCGLVTEGQIIEYFLELQYLNDAVSTGGQSGRLTVTNQIPKGLIYNHDAVISEVRRIDGGDNGRTDGEIIGELSVSEDNVLTFTADGLSAGAKYVVTYTCTVPNPGPEGYTEFLNTAWVDDNGLEDAADPVLHYMNAGPQTFYTVTYSYENAPAGAVVPAPVRCPEGTEILLPSPAVSGFQFNGWKLEGADPAFPGGGSYTVNGDAHFTGSWTQLAGPEPVKLDYSFDDTPPVPDNALLILEGLLDGVALSVPAFSTTTAPQLTVLPEGWSFQWQYPGQLSIDQNGAFNVGEAQNWPPDGTIHIVGKWTKTEYEVAYAYSGAPDGAPPLPQTRRYAWGTDVVLAPEPASTETHLFLGWSGMETDETGKFEMPMEDVTITGSWVQRTADQEVKIDPNGGTWNGSEEESVLLLSDYQAQIAADAFPDAAREGYTFEGWTESGDPEGIFTKILTANWKSDTPVTPDPPDIPDPIFYTVTFDVQGGAPSPASQRVPAHSRAHRPAAPTREGYVFQGWYRDAEGTAAWDFETDTVSQNMTLYAKWEAGEPFPVLCIVTFDAQGGAPVPAGQTVAAGGRADRPEDPVREGYMFQGWYQDAEGTAAWDFDADAVSQNMTLYAKWEAGEPLPVLCTVTFDAQGGAPVPAGQTVAADGRADRPAAPAREGYVFQGWYRDIEGTDPWDFTQDTVTGDVTLYAKWAGPEAVHTVSGTVTGPDNMPLPNAEVRIRQGNTWFGEPYITGIDGRYRFDVPNGIYNVVATYLGVTSTILVVVNSASQYDRDIQISDGNTNSLLEVEAGTPDVVVGGLKKEADKWREDAAQSAERLEVKMDVAEIQYAADAPGDASGANQEEIRAIREEARRYSANARIGLILDITLGVEITTEDGTHRENIHSTGDNILEIVIPYPEMEGKEGIRVHRYHDMGEDHEGAITFIEVFSRPEEDGRKDKTFFLDRENGLVHIFARKFSLYAISYRIPAPVPDVPQIPQYPGGGQPSGSRPDSDSVSTPEPSAPELLNTEAHILYLHGFPDGSFRPESNMTRAQAAQMFYNLLSDRTFSGSCPFRDIPAIVWYREAVNTLYALDIMQGVQDRLFEPDRPITRAEFVTVVSRFMRQSGSGSISFSDVSESDWFYPQIVSASAYGWIDGYPDGTFRPGEPITRAEAAAIVNRLLNRNADKVFVDSHQDLLRTFTDLHPNYWAYYDILEAANAHSYQIEDEKGERWTTIDS